MTSRPFAFLGFALALLLASCAATASTAPSDPATVPLKDRKPVAVKSVDLEQYMGRWYEVARYPNRFQRGTVGTIAHYQLRKNGRITLKNSAHKKTLDGKITKGDGSGRVLRKSKGAKWSVQFVWPFTADYWIIEHCPKYSWAVVGQPSKKNLWILSRTPRLDDATWKNVTDRLAKHGYDKAKLKKTLQPKDAKPFKPGADGKA